MIITDSSWTYDTDLMIQYAKMEERSSYERDMLQQFRKYMYWRYCQIRNCVNTRKCKRMSLDKVKEKLQDENELNYTINLLKISNEEVFFILDFIEKYFEMIV
ncbi:hypothetical protein OCB72_28985 [Bacillus cereus]|nr:hypothetical protein [Bacillus cereus]